MAGTFVPCVNTAYAALQFSQPDGEFCQFGLWVERDEAWDVTALQNLASDLAGGWNTPTGGHAILKDHMAGDYTAIQATARDFTTIDSPSVVVSGGLPISAGGSTPAAPQGIAFCVTLRTGLAGRNFRGRMFIPGIPLGSFDSTSTNVLTTAAAAEFVDGVQNIIDTINGGDGSHSKVVICSRFSKTENPVAPFNRATAVLTEVTSAGYHDLFCDFQRRRAPAHNRHH